MNETSDCNFKALRYNYKKKSNQTKNMNSVFFWLSEDVIMGRNLFYLKYFNTESLRHHNYCIGI